MLAAGPLPFAALPVATGLTVYHPSERNRRVGTRAEHVLRLVVLRASGQASLRERAGRPAQERVDNRRRAGVEGVRVRTRLAGSYAGVTNRYVRRSKIVGDSRRVLRMSGIEKGSKRRKSTHRAFDCGSKRTTRPIDHRGGLGISCGVRLQRPPGRRFQSTAAPSATVFVGARHASAA
jgi:hypothetical protein